jgi:hypothetical protein
LKGGPVGDSRCDPAEVEIVELSERIGELVADDFPEHLYSRDEQVLVLGGEKVVEGWFGIGAVAAPRVEARQFGGLDEVACDGGVGA